MIADRLQALLQVAFAPGIVRALNRAAVSGQVVMVRAIAAELGVRQADVKPYVRVRKAGLDTLQARVYAFGKIPLIQLGATGPQPSRGKGGGVSVRANPGRYPHAFIARVRAGKSAGHLGVFERVGVARLPIHELSTSPIARIFQRYRADGNARAQEALQTNLQSELKYALLKQSAS